MATIYINDTAIEDLGLVLVDGGPDIAGLSISRGRQVWQGRAGSLPDQYGMVESRIIKFAVEKSVASYAERTAILDLLADVLTGVVEVRFADQEDRVIRGIPRVFTAEVSTSPKWVNIDPRIQIEIECFNAGKWSVEPESRVLTAITTDRVPIPVGTLPHGGQFYLTGPDTTERVLSYRSMKGTLLGQIIFTPVLLTGEYCVLDLDTESIIQYSATGVASNASRWLAPTSIWFRIFPRDADRAQSAWPTVEGNAIFIYLFRLGWAS